MRQQLLLLPLLGNVDGSQRLEGICTACEGLRLLEGEGGLVVQARRAP